MLSYNPALCTVTAHHGPGCKPGWIIPEQFGTRYWGGSSNN